MVHRLRNFIAVLLMIAVSAQAAWSMAPACGGGDQLLSGTDAHPMGAAQVSFDADAESAQECDCMMVRCASAILPGPLPELADATGCQRFNAAPAPDVLFFTSAPDRPPRLAFA